MQNPYRAMMAAALILVWLLSVAQPAGAQSGLQNPGFEVFTGSTPVGWSVTSGSTTAALTQRRGGALALGVYSSGVGLSGACQQVAVTAGLNTASIWVSGRFSGGGQAVIALGDGAGDTALAITSSSVPTGSWTALTVSKVVSSGQAVICVRSTRSAGTIGDVAFDDVVIYAGAPSPTATALPTPPVTNMPTTPPTNTPTNTPTASPTSSPPPATEVPPTPTFRLYLPIYTTGHADADSITDSHTHRHSDGRAHSAPNRNGHDLAAGGAGAGLGTVPRRDGAAGA